jgi:hypothetical protein
VNLGNLMSKVSRHEVICLEHRPQAGLDHFGSSSTKLPAELKTRMVPSLLPYLDMLTETLFRAERQSNV